MRAHCALAFAAVLALTACGGGGAGLPPQSTVPTNVPAVAQASITLAVPLSVQSLSLALTGINGSPATYPLVTANLTAQSPGCAAQNGGTACTITTSFPVGTDTLSVTLFTAANGTGAALGNATATAKLVAGTITPVAFSFGGVVASVSVAAATTHPIAGIATTIPLSVTALDASGATIIGAYTTPIDLSNSDTSGQTTLSSSTISSSSTSVSLSYTGSLQVAEAKITANAFGVTPGPRATVSIVPVGQSGSNALAMLTTTTGSVYAFVPTATGLSQVLISTGNGIAASTRHQLSIPAPISISPAPNACAINAPDKLLACISFSSPTITNFYINNNGSLTQQASVTTDAPAAGVSNSGGTCIICGIEYDDTDDAYIIATANGYEVYTSPTENSYIQHAWTIPGNVAENFGYNPVTNMILSPVYATIDATGLTYMNVTNKTSYVIATQPAGLFEPDAAAFDSATNIAAVTEEVANANGTNDLFLENMGSAALNSPSSGQFTATQTTLMLTSSLFGRASATTCDVPVTGIAIDPASHLAFVGSEFCGQGNGSGDGAVTPFGVLALPTSSHAALAISSQVYLTMPPLPDGSLWNDPGDPHAIAAMPISGLCSPCGITYNAESTWLAIIDMQALRSAPRSPSDPNLAIIPSTPPYGNIVTYVKAQ